MRRAALLALVLAPALLSAQTRQPANRAPRVPQGKVHVPFALQVAQPLGDFSDNVKSVAIGFTGGAIMRLGSSPFAVRADLGFATYGARTRRERLGSGALGLIAVDVRTTNNILDGGLGLQVGVPGKSVTPYVGGSVGFAYLFTESSVSGRQNTQAQPFATSTNIDDGTFQPSLFGGVYVPFAGGKGTVDLGLRWANGGEARYLTRDGISFNASGNPVLDPKRSPTAYLSYRVGVTLNVF